MSSSANALPPPSLEVRVDIAALVGSTVTNYISHLKWLNSNLISLVIVQPIFPFLFIYIDLEGITFKIFIALTMCSILSTLLGLALFLGFGYKIQHINNAWLRNCIQYGCLIFSGVTFYLILWFYMASKGRTIRVVAAPPT
jgi:hypothetical protein